MDLESPIYMRTKLSKNRGEVCYPLMYEKSLKCDFEILADDLCRQVGAILAVMPPEFPVLITQLEQLQPMIYHLNGSIRGKCAVSEGDVVWLRELYLGHRAATEESVSGSAAGFVLPRGAAPVPQLNAASSTAKRAIRLMVRLYDEEAVEIPEVLHRFANVVCNYLFVLTLVINRARGEVEVPFVSQSYPERTRRKT